MAITCALAVASTASLEACKPPASDEYVARTRLAEVAEGPSDPIDSPDTENAVWVPIAGTTRIVYGEPGQHPLFALECSREAGMPRIVYTRYARADRQAKAILALIGNGHVERFDIDSTRVGDVWLWRGAVSADNAQLDVLTGARQVEATVPGAGSVILNPSALPRELIESCQMTSERVRQDS